METNHDWFARMQSMQRRLIALCVAGCAYVAWELLPVIAEVLA